MSASEELRALANEIDHDLASGTVIARKLRILALARPSGTEGPGLRERIIKVRDALETVIEVGARPSHEAILEMLDAALAEGEKR
jgi:hypothetical protein